MDMQQLLTELVPVAASVGARLATALTIFLVGRWVAKSVSNLIQRMLEKAEVDTTLITFAANTVHILLMVAVGLAVLDRLGIETTSVLALLMAGGLAVGMALQGSLANLAAGVLLILFRPFKVGELIEADDVMGFVEGLYILNTRIRTQENRLVTMPNSKLTGDNITNYSTLGTLRVDLTVRVNYEEDIDRVIRIINLALRTDDRVLQIPEPIVHVAALNAFCVDIAVWPHCKSEDYWKVRFGVLENIKRAFDLHGISAPMPGFAALLDGGEPSGNRRAV